MLLVIGIERASFLNLWQLFLQQLDNLARRAADLIRFEITAQQIEPVHVRDVFVDARFVLIVQTYENNERKANAQPEHVDGSVHLVSRQEGEIGFEIE